MGLRMNPHSLSPSTTDTQWELAEWGKYEREDLMEVIYKKGPLWGWGYDYAAETDLFKIRFLDFIRV